MLLAMTAMLVVHLLCILTRAENRLIITYLAGIFALLAQMKGPTP